MFHLLSNVARGILKSAMREARRTGHACIGPSHLLIGIMDEGACAGARALKDCGLDTRTIRDALILHDQSDPTGISCEELPFTPEAKQALEWAVDYSEILGSKSVGTGHLLLGLLRLDGGPVQKLLNDRGILAEKFHGQVLRLLGDTSG